jgi:homoserine O-acetyltransferase/O-succinyltransferase
MLVAQRPFSLVNWKVEEPLILESGNTLWDLRIQYSTYGELNTDRSNIVWVFHAMTANCEVADWWSGLVGENDFINPNEHFIICANMLGSCYGSTEPIDFEFPLITIHDMVKAHKLLKNRLGIEKIKLGIGGSMGGQQLLQWAVEEPDLFETIVPIASNAKHSPWGIAFNEAQRMALTNSDSQKGLEAARAIALLSYRNYETYDGSQKDDDDRVDGFSASSYQQYQGAKLTKRFTPYSYFTLSKAMDSHNVGRHYGGIKTALARINSRAIVIGVDTDILFPIEEQQLIADHIKNASIHVISSVYGHDGFLIETNQISQILTQKLS